MKLRVTSHAIGRMWQRKLAVRQLEQAIEAPDWTATDPTDQRATRYYRRFGRTVWRVVARPEGIGYVVTAFPDRNARRP